MTPRLPTRRGVSLLEVLIATAMLFGAVVVLAELAQIGRRHAESAGERVAAQELCRQKLSEILLGLLPVSAASGPIEEAQGWVYQVEVEPLQDFAELDDLVRVRVTVEQDPQAPEMARRRTGRTFQLTRWMRVPRGESQSSSMDGSLATLPVRETPGSRSPTVSGRNLSP
jgi:Tfp pilus assembly protein PilV